MSRAAAAAACADAESFAPVASTILSTICGAKDRNWKARSSRNRRRKSQENSLSHESLPIRTKPPSRWTCLIMIHVCSPVRSLEVWRIYTGENPDRFQNLCN
ncbi:hypothetical protein BASA50_010651 [Batrachochytrium salamandrivorans]|uniref:Secreted protein n=1 Tax=Batrachochytrium salamandrivorans TaxID=1357716 RepID=A0ABQ8EZ05_9FUNG|nr:hypothetical protein BASA50_010651 [Batrachochytrium salamandrivorans]